MKIIFLNNYPMTTARQLHSRGEYPGQHLWGISEIQREMLVSIPHWTIVQNSKSRLANKIKSTILPLIGDPFQQLYAISSRSDSCVIYAADQQTPVLLALLRRAKLIKTPLVMMSHNGPRTRWTKFWMRGIDRILVLSAGAERRMKEIYPDLADRIRTMPWGPELGSPLYADPANEILYDFVAAGKTNRDYTWLRDRAVAEKLTGVIIQSTSIEYISNGNIETRQNDLSYREIVEIMKKSRVIAIPLDDPHRLSGLTEASDAIGIKKPILVTESELFPYDVAQYRIGSWINPNISLIDNISNCTNAALEWSNKIHDSYSTKTYADALRKVFKEVIHDN